MQLKSNNNAMLSRLTKSINGNAVMTIKTRIERTNSGRFVVRKANSVDDECSSEYEAVSSCSDNDDKLFTMTSTATTDKCHNSSSMQSFDEADTENEDSDDLTLDNIDVTFFSDDDNSTTPKNDAERMFFEVVESLRYEQEVRNGNMLIFHHSFSLFAYQKIFVTLTLIERGQSSGSCFDNALKIFNFSLKACMT
jgi:hypothetical protein